MRPLWRACLIYSLAVCLTACGHLAASPQQPAQTVLAATAVLGKSPSAAVQMHLDMSPKTHVFVQVQATQASDVAWDVHAGMPHARQALRLGAQASFVTHTVGLWHWRVGAWPGAPRTGLAAMPAAAPWGVGLWHTSPCNTGRRARVGVLWGTVVRTVPAHAWAWQGDVWQGVRGCQSARDCPHPSTCGTHHVCIAKHGLSVADTRQSVFALPDGMHVDALRFVAQHTLGPIDVALQGDIEHRHLTKLAEARAVFAAPGLTARQYAFRTALTARWGGVAVDDVALPARQPRRTRASKRFARALRVDPALLQRRFDGVLDARYAFDRAGTLTAHLEQHLGLAWMSGAASVQTTPAVFALHTPRHQARTYAARVRLVAPLSRRLRGTGGARLRRSVTGEHTLPLTVGLSWRPVTPQHWAWRLQLHVRPIGRRPCRQPRLQLETGLGKGVDVTRRVHVRLSLGARAGGLHPQSFQGCVQVQHRAARAQLFAAGQWQQTPDGKQNPWVWRLGARLPWGPTSMHLQVMAQPPPSEGAWVLMAGVRLTLRL